MVDAGQGISCSGLGRFAGDSPLALAHGSSDLAGCSLGLSSLVFKDNSNRWVWYTPTLSGSVVSPDPRLAAGPSGQTVGADAFS